jgi:hypothetical protein
MFGLHLTTATRWLASAALAVTLGACASDGEDFQAGSPPIDEGGNGGVDDCGATTILKQTCGGCHGGTAPAQGLDLFASGLKGRVADVAAKGCGGEILVVPGDAAASYLMAKIEGTHGEGCGVQMPKGGTPLSSTDQNCVARWIDAMGASSPGGDSSDDSDDDPTPGGGGGGW